MLNKTIEYIKKNLVYTAIISVILTVLCCVVITSVLIYYNYQNLSNIDNISKTGSLGDTFNGLLGPFIALLVAILTFLAFYVQYKANEKQNIENAKQDKNNQILQFENNFFELIKLHRANVDELKYSKYYNNQVYLSENRKVFKVIFEEFTDCYRDVKKFSNSSNPDDYLNSNYRTKLQSIINNINPKIDIIEMALVDISYSILFFGIGDEGEKILREKFKDRYNKFYFYRLLTFIKQKPKRENARRYAFWEQLRSYELTKLHPIIEEVYQNREKQNPDENLSETAKYILTYNKYEKHYGGHQHRLGHYFRHLFQTYKFLSGFNLLDNNQKYFYGKTLRAQLSTYEQALLFVNSLSNLGMKWEYKAEIGEISDLTTDEIVERSKDIKLISRYNLIKNLPGTRSFDLKFEVYYPYVDFEYDEE